MTDKMDEDKPVVVKKVKKATMGQPSASEDSASKYPDMALCQKIHRLTTKQTLAFSKDEQQAVFDKIAKELENPSLYKHVVEMAGSDVCGALTLLTDTQLAEMETKNKTTLEELEAKVEEAKESAGDMEVMDARVEVARFAAKSLSETDALAAYGKLIDLPKISSGKKIDALMETSRVASFYGDTKKSDEYIDKAHKLATEGSGGDWDRRNRLKVYRALSNLLARDMKGAASLLVDCIATFSCNEICSYQDFIVYTILSNLLHIPRPLLKEKIIDGPEILSVASEIPVVIQLTQSLYDCDYKAYLHAMVELEGILFADRYLFPHAAFWMRELHILAYKQFLDAYQSVTLAAMAKSFGVSTDFIDYHASRFIAAGRLSAKIDKFGGVIVTNRPDLKNAQYRDMIQKGDLLLNRIQKLARVVDV
ncbi:ATPase regulatory subunit 6 [Seminavis robusta]|uniref:ATPase regulatory subunit 6 n=1 Tax=Seminavis robusta TaxID=568900 RepID=A0A9N8EX93_9STRA|nr:ATPase regulatory subunit 6 [Seminavis robusta]|eukprot:Sro2134_g315960.1 ATPase regulatory subunit 6 (422) ;mRNA; r:15227-16635